MVESGTKCREWGNMKDKKLKSIDVECAVSRYFNPRVNLIVPNVWWGMGLNYEIDMLIVTPSNYCYEVEVKVSNADIKADLKKWNAHNGKMIKRLYFAIPDYLNTEYIPERAGILTIYQKNNRLYCKCTRNPKVNTQVEKITDKDRYKIARLGALRIWSLKRKLRGK